MPGADGRLGQRRLFSQVPGDSAGQGKEEKAQNDKDQDFKGKQAGFRIVDNSKDAAMYLAVLMGLAGFSLYAYYKAKEGNIHPSPFGDSNSCIQWSVCVGFKS